MCRVERGLIGSSGEIGVFKKEKLSQIKEKRTDWEKNYYSNMVKNHSERKGKFENLSGTEISSI